MAERRLGEGGTLGVGAGPQALHTPGASFLAEAALLLSSCVPRLFPRTREGCGAGSVGYVSGAALTPGA